MLVRMKSGRCCCNQERPPISWTRNGFFYRSAQWPPCGWSKNINASSTDPEDTEYPPAFPIEAHPNKVRPLIGVGPDLNDDSKIYTGMFWLGGSFSSTGSPWPDLDLYTYGEAEIPGDTEDPGKPIVTLGECRLKALRLNTSEFMHSADPYNPSELFEFCDLGPADFYNEQYLFNYQGYVDVGDALVRWGNPVINITSLINEIKTDPFYQANPNIPQMFMVEPEHDVDWPQIGEAGPHLWYPTNGAFGLTINLG